MNKIIAIGFALAAMLLPLTGQAQPQAGPMTSATTTIITCPEMINGVELERTHQYQVPNGWSDEASGAGGYGGAVLYRSKYYLSNGGKKLYCAYGARSGNSVYDLVVIVRNAPAGRTCSKGADYTFRCPFPRMRRMQ